MSFREIGQQIVILCEQCPASLFHDVSAFIHSIKTLAQESGLHVVASVEREFEPVGLTMALILAESHLVVHTWPEKCIMSIDLFVCQDEFSLEEFLERVKSVSRAAHVNVVCLVDQ